MFDPPASETSDANRPEVELLATLRSASAGLAEVWPIAGQPARELLDAVASTEQLLTQVQVLQARVLAALKMEPIETADIGY